MDNFTHSLAGWVIGQAGLKRKSRKGLAALILSANMPDIDVFLAWVPWIPLATHRGFTHSLLGGVVIMPPLLALLLWALDRWQVSRGIRFKSGLDMRFGWLLALCFIGAATHPLLDLQTSYAVQLLSPFSDAWFHEESLFIIDVWLWTGLAFAIWLSRRRESRGEEWRRPAQVAILTAIADIGGNWLISQKSVSLARAAVPHAVSLDGDRVKVERRMLYRDVAQFRQPPPEGAIHPDTLVNSIGPVIFWRRTVVWRGDGIIGTADYDPLREWNGIIVTGEVRRENLDLPAVRLAAKSSPEMEEFLRWSWLPMAEVEEMKGCRIRVAISDARYSFSGISNRFRHEAIVSLADCDREQVNLQ